MTHPTLNYKIRQKYSKMACGLDLRLTISWHMKHLWPHFQLHLGKLFGWVPSRQSCLIVIDRVPASQVSSWFCRRHFASFVQMLYHRRTVRRWRHLTLWLSEAKPIWQVQRGFWNDQVKLKLLLSSLISQFMTPLFVLGQFLQVTLYNRAITVYDCTHLFVS